MVMLKRKKKRFVSCNSMENYGPEIEHGASSFHIDERLHRVLGHCRFYFQEVPLPNCHGVRFGKYGSFLTDSQHSPSNSPVQANSQNIFSYNISKSPQTVPLDDSHGTTSRRCLKFLAMENGPESTTITSRAEGNSSRRDVSRKGSVTCSADQSSHALPNKRIKLDKENLPAPKNKHLYQSLGLALSSSSSKGHRPLREHYLKGSDELGQTSSRTNIIESSRDIWHRWDSERKRDSKRPVCPNSPLKHFSPVPSGMPTSLMEMGNMTKKDAKYRSAGEIEEMVTVRYNEEHKEFPAYMRQSREHDGSNCSRGSYDAKLRNFTGNIEGETRKHCQRNDEESKFPKICKSSDMTPPTPVEFQKLTDEASEVIKEADNLMHSADILKSSGCRIESTEFFFQAALKYLDAASLLDTDVLGSYKNAEQTPFALYDATSNLLEFCAQEYERSKDMGCAALAYKCLEASNMRIVYSSCQELQVSFQSLTSGLTSVINASNDNIKNQKYLETNDVPKDSTYSKPAETYPLDSTSRSMFVELLNFTKYVNCAMDASRKSEITFGYASQILEEEGSTEIIGWIKRALNYGFYDMKRLLYLVYEAIEALSS